MPPVFGRSTLNPHPYDYGLDLLMPKSSGDRAMAINIRCDHRVSVERERQFDAFISSPCDDLVLQRAIIEYHNRRVRERKRPDYVYDSLNGLNILNGRSHGRPQIKSSLELVRALDLNGLRYLFSWAQTFGNKKHLGRWGKTFDSFPRNPADDSAVLAFLDSQMRSSSVEKFLKVVLDLLNVSLLAEKRPFQPTWATTWKQFGRYVKEGPERWAELLGVNKPYPCWLVLLKYTVREAGTVARPTQLDGGWYMFHFPSPPSLPVSRGGHPMDLRTVPLPGGLLPEYIHKQIPHSLSHWKSVGPLNYGRINVPFSSSLREQRINHHYLLIKRYGGSVVSWMNSPI